MVGSRERRDRGQRAVDLPVEGHVELGMPVEDLWDIFTRVPAWPRWNGCIRWARVAGGTLGAGATLYWVFNPIRPWYPYKLPAVARIVEFEPHRRVTWQVSALPGFSARHSYLFESLGPDRCRFGSTEVASGPLYQKFERWWQAHFRYVLRESLLGAQRLERGEVPPPGASVADPPDVRLLEFGPARGTPLVAVPGLDGSPGTILTLVERLARSRRVVVADYSRERTASLEELTSRVVEVTRDKLSGPVDVLGESLGSIVAAQMSSRSGSDVRRLVLVGTFTRLSTWPLRGTMVSARLAPRGAYRVLTPLLMSYVCGPVGDGADDPFFSYLRESDPRGAAKRTGWEIGRDFGQDLRKIRHPALVVMGAKDRFVPDIRREVRKLNAVLRDKQARVVQISGAGHVLLPRAAIESAANEIEAFLE